MRSPHCSLKEMTLFPRSHLGLMWLSLRLPAYEPFLVAPRTLRRLRSVIAVVGLLPVGMSFTRPSSASPPAPARSSPLTKDAFTAVFGGLNNRPPFSPIAGRRNHWPDEPAGLLTDLLGKGDFNGQGQPDGVTVMAGFEGGGKVRRKTRDPAKLKTWGRIANPIRHGQTVISALYFAGPPNPNSLPLYTRRGSPF